MKLTFIGCGDAFGTGGRFNTCFLAEHAGGAFLIDCGASSMVAMRKLGIDPNAIGTIVISHLHGDHFGGLPFFILDAQFYSRRQEDLTIVGPPGLAERLLQAMEVFFPGSAHAKRKFELRMVEVPPGETIRAGALEVAAHEVMHACGAPALGLRIGCDGKVIAYSGDTEWTDALLAVSRDADLFIVEALSYEKKITQHLDYATFRDNESALTARRIILTHLGPDMLQRAGHAKHEIAHDGLVLDF